MSKVLNIDDYIKLIKASAESKIKQARLLENSKEGIVKIQKVTGHDEYDAAYYNKACDKYKQDADALLTVAMWLEDYKRLRQKEREYPTELYAIEDTENQRIIFNARGGAYKDKADALRKLADMPNSAECRLVTYKLVAEM